MSARLEKLKRRAARAELGISKDAERGMREFEAEVARLRARQVVEAEQPIVSLQPKRRALALVGLALFAVSILALILGSC